MWKRLGPVWVRRSKYPLIIIIIITILRNSRLFVIGSSSVTAFDFVVFLSFTSVGEILLKGDTTYVIIVIQTKNAD